MQRNLESQSNNECGHDDNGEANDNDNMIDESECHYLPARNQVRDSMATKCGVHSWAMNESFLETFGFYEFWKRLNKVR